MSPQKSKIFVGINAGLCSGSTEDFGLLDSYKLVSNFLKSRRQGLSSEPLRFYKAYLTRARLVVGLEVTGRDIQQFLNFLNCSGGGKHAYFRALRAFYNWLYSPK